MKTKSVHILLVAHLLLATASLNLFAAATNSPRERLLMDFGWKFHLGNEWGIAQNLSKAASGSGPANVWFGDASWRTVDLPHDWAVELPFDQTADAAHGFKALGHGFSSNNVAWYRRTFELPKADAGKRLWLEFDGAFRDCEIFVNGWSIGHHENGYDGFHYDITDVVNCGGKNVVAVKVDASEFEGWFYEGAGIYRHVWLEKAASVAIAPDGVFVYSQFKNNVPAKKAAIHVETQLLNSQTNSACAKVHCEIINPEGKSIASFKESARLKPRSKCEVKLDTTFQSPELWSPESPNLYKLVTTVESGGQVIDRQETEFGIRTVAFDPEKGFLLNGQPYKIKGTCNHQDHAGVGVALPDALQYFRVQKLKEMGCNAYRTSHNPPTPELLEACDRLGLLVLDENRLVGSDPLHLKWFEEFIRRDRNHPSVFAWSLGNEEWNAQGTAEGQTVIRTMQNLAHLLDPTRLCTANINGSYGETGFVAVIDVKGFSYNISSMDSYHTNHPNANILGTETASTVTTRGIYTNDTTKGYVAAYDIITTNQSKDFPTPVTWGETAEGWWSFYNARPWSSGGFAWTGFDYRGEPTPYRWPCINSHFGILDMCGFRKDNFYYYQAWWTDKPVLHLLPHWNWQDREDQEIDVRALSNCEEVELFLNGQSLGKQKMEKNSELKWKVKYAPGTLSAKGYKNGQLVAETKVETTGAPATVQLTPDRSTLNADGEDVGVFTVAVTDAQGRVVPVATNLVQFELSGPGKILGVGNGDPSCHEPDVYLPVWPNYSVDASDGWHWEKITDPWKTNLLELAAKSDDSTWTNADVQSVTNQLSDNEHGIFRTHINVTEKELAADVVELCFGSINGGMGTIYVNGQKAGESHDGGMVAAIDVKHLLHSGTNAVVVVVANYSSSGGIVKGVTLRMQEKPILPEWKRSVFNGLAQIIVQSTKEPGEIKLTARAGDLTPATATIQSQSGPLRPCVP